MSFLRLLFSIVAFCAVFVGTAGALLYGLAFLFILVACTGGISLIVAAPMAIFALWLEFKILKSCWRALIHRPKTFTPVGHTQSALMQYITNAASQGIHQSEIIQMLKSSGWSDNDIEAAYTATKK